MSWKDTPLLGPEDAEWIRAEHEELERAHSSAAIQALEHQARPYEAMLERSATPRRGAPPMLRARANVPRSGERPKLGRTR
jgi:hypothetical protein